MQIQCSVNAFCETEKEHVARELQAAYNEEIPTWEDENYKCRYSVGYVVGYSNAKARLATKISEDGVQPRKSCRSEE